MQKRIEQLFRTKKYRRLSTALDIARGKLKRTPEHSTLLAQKSGLISEMKAMQREYRLTWQDCREDAQRLAPQFDAPSIFALTKAEDVWRSVSQQLAVGVARYTPLKMRTRFDWVTLRAKQIERGITLTVKNNRVWFGVDGLSFTYRDDDFIAAEMALVTKYLADAERIDHEALAAFRRTGVAMDTFKPCFVTIVPKEIRGRLRVYLHLLVEAAALPRPRRPGALSPGERLASLQRASYHYEMKREELRGKMRLAKKAALAGYGMAVSLRRLQIAYQDNKRHLREAMRKSEVLAAQKEM